MHHQPMFTRAYHIQEHYADWFASPAMRTRLDALEWTELHICSVNYERGKEPYHTAYRFIIINPSIRDIHRFSCSFTFLDMLTGASKVLSSPRGSLALLL